MMQEDKLKLEKLGEKAITKVFKDVLSLLEVSGLSEEQFKRIRKQVLRSGNDEIRKFSEELEKYDVTYNPSYNETIVFDKES